MKRAWKYLIAEPFIWIFYAFFQPRRLQRELGVIRLQLRLLLIFRVLLPIFLLACIVVLFLVILLYPTPVTSKISLLLTSKISLLLTSKISLLFTNKISLLLLVFIYAIGGVGIVIGGAVLLQVLARVVSLEILALFAGSGLIAIISLIGVRLGMGAVGVGAVGLGIFMSLGTEGLGSWLSSVFIGILGALIVGILGLAVGNDTFVSVITGFFSSCCYFIGLFRLPFYLISGLSTFQAYLASSKDPMRVFTFLQKSSLHWDEIVYLHLPYLKRMLLLAYDQDTEHALEEITFIATERPRQIWAAQAALLQIAIHDLEGRTSIDEIAGALLFLDDLFPQETKLLDPQWATPIKRLRDASRDAQRFNEPVGRHARREALQDMVRQLKRVHSSVDIGDARLRSRLSTVVSSWQALAVQELEKLEQIPDYLGHIDNPYNPGKALKPDDPLFLGRRDLVHLLEMELLKGERHSTFLMTGERRMGKSSTLLQLPRLLGSRSLPVFYDLQSSGILASTSIFLSTIAEGIAKKMQERDMPVKRLVYRSLRSFSQQSPSVADIASSINYEKTPYEESASSAFYLFTRWLKQAEDFLEQEDRTILLLFDEFEKLEEAAQRRSFDLPLLLDWFRTIIQYHPRIVLLFSGVRTFSEMGQQNKLNWSGYFVNVQTLHVSFLHEEEARRLVITPIPNFPGSEIYGDGVVERILFETACHPFLIQAVCSALIDLLNVQKKVQAELSDVTKAIEITFNNWWDTYFRDLWLRTDDPQRLCLIALVKLTSANVSQIQAQSGLDGKSVQRTLRILLKRDLVHEDDSELYQISTPIFCRWVERCMEDE